MMSKQASQMTSSVTDDVNSKNGVHQRRGSSVVLFHDSIMNGINAAELGKALHVYVRKIKTLTCEDVKYEAQKLEDHNVEAVIIHCGINNLRQNQDSMKAATNIISTIRALRIQHPKTRVVVSRVAPVKDPELLAKRDFFNAVLFREVLGMKDRFVTFINHDQLIDPLLRGRDGIHPNQRGSDVLTRNLGRHIHSLLWQSPRRSARNHVFRQQDWWDWRGQRIVSSAWQK